MYFKAKVTGLAAIEKTLDSIADPKFRARTLRKAGKNAMKPVLADAILRAPLLKSNGKNNKVVAGLLKGDIKMVTSVRTTPLTKKGNLPRQLRRRNELNVSVQTGKETEDFALITEYGRVGFVAKRTTVFGKKVAPYEVRIPAVEAKPWFGQILFDHKERIVADFSNTMVDLINKEIKKRERAALREQKKEEKRLKEQARMAGGA